MTLFNSAPQSLCILRLSAIGDVCNTVAAVQAIQAHWPETRITWITGKLEASLIADLPGVEVIVFDKKQGWQSYRQLWKTLQGRHFDALLHMQYALRASIATLGIKARYKLGFDAKRSQDFQTWFTNIKVASPQAPHVLDGLMAFGHTLGVPTSPPHWSIPYSQADTEWAQTQLSSQKRNLVVVPGASKSYKNWTPEGYAQVIEHAHQQGWHVIIAGSPSPVETHLCASITQILSVPISNIVGKSSIKQMLALLSHADMAIAPDTGPAHMANAVNTPVIGLYAHHNPQRTGPYQYRQYVVSAYETAIAEEHQKPIADLDWRTRVKDETAMERITIPAVINMFDRVVADFNL